MTKRVSTLVILYIYTLGGSVRHTLSIHLLHCKHPSKILSTMASSSLSLTNNSPVNHMSLCQQTGKTLAQKLMARKQVDFLLTEPREVQQWVVPYLKRDHLIDFLRKAGGLEAMEKGFIGRQMQALVSRFYHQMNKCVLQTTIDEYEMQLSQFATFQAFKDGDQLAVYLYEMGLGGQFPQPLVDLTPRTAYYQHLYFDHVYIAPPPPVDVSQFVEPMREESLAYKLTQQSMDAPEDPPANFANEDPHCLYITMGQMVNSFRKGRHQEVLTMGFHLSHTLAQEDNPLAVDMLCMMAMSSGDLCLRTQVTLGLLRDAVRRVKSPYHRIKIYLACQRVTMSYGAFYMSQHVYRQSVFYDSVSLFRKEALLNHLRSELEMAENELLYRHCLLEFHKFCTNCDAVDRPFEMGTRNSKRLVALRQLVMRESRLSMGLQYYFMTYVSLLEAVHTALETDDMSHPEVVRNIDMARMELEYCHDKLDSSSAFALEAEGLGCFFTLYGKSMQEYREEMEEVAEKWEERNHNLHSTSLANVYIQQFLLVSVLSPNASNQRWLINLASLQLSAYTKDRHYRLRILQVCRHMIIYRNYHVSREDIGLEEDICLNKYEDQRELVRFFKSGGKEMCTHPISRLSLPGCCCRRLSETEPWSARDYAQIDWLLGHCLHFGELALLHQFHPDQLNNRCPPSTNP